MRLGRSLVVTVCGLALIGVSVGVVRGQNPFRLYRSFEPYDNVKLPDDWQEKTEWVFARLMYPEHPNALLARRVRYPAAVPLDFRRELIHLAATVGGDGDFAESHAMPMELVCAKA